MVNIKVNPLPRWKAVDELMDYLEEADDGSGELENSQYEEEEEDEEEDNTEENNEDFVTNFEDINEH